MFRSREVHRAIDAIYAAAAAPEQWPHVLDAIAECFDGEGTVLLLPRVGKTTTIVSPRLEAAARDYEAWAWKLDFYVPRVLASIVERNACYTDQALGTPDEIGKHPFYTDFRTPHGLGPFLGTAIMPAPDTVAFMTIQGRLSRSSFTESEVELCGTIGRHAERSLMLSLRLMEAEARAEAMSDAFSRMACGVFALDDTGSIAFANAAAERIVGHGLLVKEGRLVLEGPHSNRFEQAVQSASEQVGAGSHSSLRKLISPLALARPDSDERLMLYFIPIGQEMPGVLRETFTRSRLLVLAIAHPGEQPDPALIRDALGLTHGEARLAAFIGRGKSPKEAAEALGITEGSARVVLKRVFLKTNTSRQAELTSLLSRLLLSSGIDEPA